MKTDGLYFKHPVGRKIEDIHSVSLESGCKITAFILHDFAKRANFRPF